MTKRFDTSPEPPPPPKRKRELDVEVLFFPQPKKGTITEQERAASDVLIQEARCLASVIRERGMPGTVPVPAVVHMLEGAISELQGLGKHSNLQQIALVFAKIGGLGHHCLLSIIKQSSKLEGHSG